MVQLCLIRKQLTFFIREFANNYSSAACNSFLSFQTSDSTAQLIFNNTESAIVEVLAACPNSSSSPDGVTFKLLKSITKYIVRHLNIIFQHSFYDGIFPQNWKHDIVITVYKGRGEHTTTASYRPITMSWKATGKSSLKTARRLFK